MSKTPKTCKRCSGKGFVTFTTYAGGFCMACGGDGITKAPMVRVCSASIEAPYGGSDGHVSISHRKADHRPEVWTVSTYSARIDGIDTFAEFATEAEARTAANAAFRTLKAATADYYTAREAAYAERRAAR